MYICSKLGEVRIEGWAGQEESSSIFKEDPPSLCVSLVSTKMYRLKRKCAWFREILLLFNGIDFTKPRTSLFADLCAARIGILQGQRGDGAQSFRSIQPTRPTTDEGRLLLQQMRFIVWMCKDPLRIGSYWISRAPRARPAPVSILLQMRRMPSSCLLECLAQFKSSTC